MVEIKNFFPSQQKGRNQQKVNINIDLNTLPDMNCIHCGESTFINKTRLKKLLKTISPTGQEGTINVNMLTCSKCGWLFNQKEWEEYNSGNTIDDNSKEKTIVSAEVKEKTKFNDEIYKNRTVCRKCGVFYDKDKGHNCRNEQKDKN